MTINSSRTSQPARPGRAPTAVELVDLLSRFDGPPEQFLFTLLAVQCHIASAEGGAIIRMGADGAAQVLAVHPNVEQGAMTPVWVAQSVESCPQVISSGITGVVPLAGTDDLYGQPTSRHLVMVPIHGTGATRGIGAFVVPAGDQGVLDAARERLELTISLLSLYEMRLMVQRDKVNLQRLRMAMEVLSAVNEHDRATAAAMSTVNEVASRWSCDRVSLGFLKGRYVQLKSLSHTERFSRKMELIQTVEAAMEECLDQDLEIIYPAAPEATYVCRTTEKLATRYGPTAIVSLPLRRAGEVKGVLTVERPAENPFNIEEVEALRLTCDLCTARLTTLHENDRWFGARMAEALRHGAAAFVGPKHAWAKVAAIAVFLVVMFLILAKGDYHAEAPFALRSTRRQVIPAPFAGYLQDVAVKPGDEVIGGVTVLARFDTGELVKELAAQEADKAQYDTRARNAMNAGPSKTAEYRVFKAQSDQVVARIKLTQYRIGKADLKSPISGVVVAGERLRQIGAPFKEGEAMFEVAPIESLRGEVSVPEDQIADVMAAFEQARKEESQLQGQGLLTGQILDPIEFVVEDINPVAEVIDQRNVFRVRVSLQDTNEWMRPGMEGTAKIYVGRRRYAWMWSRRLVNWLRMRWWL